VIGYSSMETFIKNIKKALVIASGFLLTMLLSETIWAASSDFYVGLDLLKTNYSTKEGYGRNVFAKNPTAFNAFVGYKLPRDFFVEAGYETTGTKKRTENGIDVADNPGILGTVARGNTSDVFTKIKIEYQYFGVGIAHPVSLFTNTKISGLMGLSITRVKALFDDLQDDELDRSFVKRKTSPVLKVSLNHSLFDKFEMSFTTIWHGMTNFKIKSEESPTGPSELRIKNGYAVGIGVIYSF
jgi:hypothetical protein